MQDFITIESEKKFISYEIIELSGRVIESKPFSNMKIGVTNITPGNYFVKLKSPSSVTDCMRFIKK